MIYTTAVHISPFSTLQFRDVKRVHENTFYPDAFKYTQKLTPSDTITIQLLANSSMPEGAYPAYIFRNDGTRVNPTEVFTAGWTMLSDNVWYSNIKIPCTGLENGVYYVEVFDVADSWAFEIGDWQDTVLVGCWNKRNDMDTVFGTFEEDNIFTLRVEGGFLPDGDTDESEYESFINQDYERMFIGATPSIKEKLTFGDADGLPMWMRNKLRLFFCCSFITVQGLRVVRAGEWSDNTNAKRTKSISIDVNVYDDMEGNVGLMNEDGYLLSTDEDKILIL